MKVTVPVWVHHYVMIVLATILGAKHQDMHVKPEHVPWIHSLMGLAMVLNSIPEIVVRIKAALMKGGMTQFPGVSTPAAAFLPAFLLLGIAGCSMTPQQLESTTAIGTQLLLDGAVKLDPKEQVHIDENARTGAILIRDQIAPMFLPTSNVGTVASGVITQSMTLLHNKLSASPTGMKVSEVVDLIEGPVVAELSSIKSPTATMPINEQMQALGLFYGVQLGISQHLKDPTLAPGPLPTPLAAPPPTTPPTPAPPPTTPPPTPAPVPGSGPPK